MLWIKRSIKKKNSQSRYSNYSNCFSPTYNCFYYPSSSPTDKEIKNSEAQTENDLADGNDKQNKLPVVSEGSSSEDSQMLGKRKRRQTGQWWLSCPQSTEETKVTDHQPTLKKSKPNNKEPSAAGPSPAKTKKERVLKRRNQTHKAPSSIQNTNKTKEKKTKRNKNRNTREDTPDKKKVTDKVLNGFEAEQIEEQQQEIVDQDPVPVDSSPLDLTHRDHSLSSGKVSDGGSIPLLKEKYLYHNLKILILPVKVRHSKPYLSKSTYLLSEKCT